MKEPIEELTKKLIEFDTTEGKTHDIAEFVKNYLEDQVISAVVDKYNDNSANVVVKLGPKDADKFILSGHLDTVPFGVRDTWDWDPLSGKVVDNMMYGRGSVDMKGGVASLIGVILELLQGDIESTLNHEVILALSGEEEIRLSGAKRLAEKGIMKG